MTPDRLPQGYRAWVVDELRGVWAVADETGDTRFHYPDPTISLEAHLSNIWERWYRRFLERPGLVDRDY